MNNPLALFPQRIAIGKVNIGGRGQDVFMTPEFFRALRDVLQRLGGPSSDVPGLGDILYESIMGPVPDADGAESFMSGETVSQMAGMDGDIEEWGREVIFASFPGSAGDGLPCVPVIQPASEGKDPESTVSQPCVSDGSPLPFLSTAVSASPVTIIADRRCAVHVDGPTDLLTYSRAGVDLDVTGTKLIEMNLGDVLIVEYTAAPTLTLIPR
jgi:hypothetical protein